MRIAQIFGRYVPPAVKGWARYRRGLYKDFFPFGTAMNGQTARLEATREIIHKCQIKTIIETGTYRGTTTEWFAGFDIPVISIEVHSPSYEFAKRRLKRYKNVSVRLGNSVNVLRTILSQPEGAMPTFVYLDAHWENYLPLKEELEIICSNLISFVILIDDFKVPDDKGYAYDDYGSGKALTEEYLDLCNVGPLQKFYPSVPSFEETGARRGWIVLTTSESISKTLETIPLLKKVEAKNAPNESSRCQKRI